MLLYIHVPGTNLFVVSRHFFLPRFNVHELIVIFINPYNFSNYLSFFVETTGIIYSGGKRKVPEDPVCIGLLTVRN